MKNGTIAAMILTAAGLFAQETGGFLIGPARGGRGGVMVEQFQQPGTMTAVEGSLIKSSPLAGPTASSAFLWDIQYRAVRLLVSPGAGV